MNKYDPNLYHQSGKSGFVWGRVPSWMQPFLLVASALPVLVADHWLMTDGKLDRMCHFPTKISGKNCMVKKARIKSIFMKINVAKCNLCKVKLQANAVSSLLPRRMGYHRGLCLSCDLHCISRWHSELIFADLVLKQIYADSGSQPFPPIFFWVCVLVSMG